MHLVGTYKLENSLKIFKAVLVLKSNTKMLE